MVLVDRVAEAALHAIPREQDLVNAPTEHPRSAFEQLFRNTRTDLLAYILRRSRGPEDAADVLAETYLIAWQKLDRIPKDERARLWLFGVARNLLMKGASRRQSGNALVERLANELRSAEPARAPLEDERRDALRAVLTALPVRDREILTMTAWEGLTPKQIAAVMGTSANIVRVRLHRARLVANWDRAAHRARRSVSEPCRDSSRRSAGSVEDNGRCRSQRRGDREPEAQDLSLASFPARAPLDPPSLAALDGARAAGDLRRRNALLARLQPGHERRPEGGVGALSGPVREDRRQAGRLPRAGHAGQPDHLPRRLRRARLGLGRGGEPACAHSPRLCDRSSALRLLRAQGPLRSCRLDAACARLQRLLRAAAAFACRAFARRGGCGERGP